MKTSDYSDYGLAQELLRARTHIPEIMAEAARRLGAYGKDRASHGQAPAQPNAVFDEKGFREWVLRNLPDDTIIGSSAYWADHLTAWAKRFVHAAPTLPPQSDPLQPLVALQEQAGMYVDDFTPQTARAARARLEGKP